MHSHPMHFRLDMPLFLRGSGRDTRALLKPFKSSHFSNGSTVRYAFAYVHSNCCQLKSLQKFWQHSARPAAGGGRVEQLVIRAVIFDFPVAGLGNHIVNQIAEHCERFSGCPSGAYFCSLEVSIIQSFTSQFLDYCTFTALA